MKRTELVEKLIKEGFSEKTLVKFSDSQLKQLASRMLSEEDLMISKKDPQYQQKVVDAKKQNKTIEAYEENLKGNQKKLDKNDNGKIDSDDFAILNKEKKGEVKEGMFGGKHKKGETIKHDGHEMDVFSKGNEKVYGHPRKVGSKNQNDKERLVYSDLDGLKKSISSMSKGEKNVNFPKSKKISNPDYKPTTVDINEVDMGLTIKSAPKSTPLFGGTSKKSSTSSFGKSATPKKKSTPKKKGEGETEEGEDSLHDIIHGAIKDKLKGDLGREPEQHEVEEEHQKYIDGCKTEGDEPKKEDGDKKFPFKKKKEESKEAVSTKDKKFIENRKIKNWVKGLVENKEFHSFTSKNEIMELIKTKLTESDTMVQHGPNVKKGHNGIPEFMSYDAIVSAEPKTAPSKPAPTTKPGTRPTPTRREDPRKTPFQPGPGPNPKPKAKIAEEKKK
jgi:hypothetical protein